MYTLAFDPSHGGAYVATLDHGTVYAVPTFDANHGGTNELPCVVKVALSHGGTNNVLLDHGGTNVLAFEPVHGAV